MRTDDGPPDPSPPADGSESWTISEVAELLAVPAPTLRSWELRYGMPTSSRTSGGHRRYSRDQVQVLRRVKELIDAGHRPGEAVSRAGAEADTRPDALVAEFVAAAEALRPAVIGEVLDNARQNLGLGRTVDDVLMPALRRIGELWQQDPARVAPEHVASYATHTWLAGSIAGPRWASSGRPKIILCCAPDEQHTLALEAFATLLRDRGADCRVLGGRTPIAALTHAVRVTDAAALILVCHLASARRGAIHALRASGLPPGKIFYAGAAFAAPGTRRGAVGAYLGENLDRAADLVLRKV